MKKTLKERRLMMANSYAKTWSLKSAVKTVSEKYNVNEASLRSDWDRRRTWPKEVFESLSDPVLRECYLLGIHKTLAQIERELNQTTNSSCRVGLLKIKAVILFKLIDTQNGVSQEVLMEKIESLERKLQGLISDKQKEKEKEK